MKIFNKTRFVENTSQISRPFATLTEKEVTAQMSKWKP